MGNDPGGSVGVAVNEALFYAKAGGSWVSADGFSVTDLTTGTSFTGSGSTTKADCRWLRESAHRLAEGCGLRLRLSGVRSLEPILLNQPS